MKASELKINNLIQSGTGIYRVAGVSEDNFIVVQDRKTGKYIELFAAIYNPIPLTEEWLLKLGFHKTAEDDFDKTFGDIDQISIRSNKLYVTDKFGVYLNPKRIAIIQYVHQLQNLYFALTGEELI